MLYIHIALCVIPIVGGLIYWPERPKTPPSEIAAAYEKGLHNEIGFLSGLKSALLDPVFLVVVFVGGQLSGITSGWQGILAQVFPTHAPLSDIHSFLGVEA